MALENYDEVKICNAMLAMLGENAISSIDDPKTDIEATCASLFPLVLGTLLSKHEWNFANPTRQLSADPGKGSDFKDGYQYAYKLPNNLVAGPFAFYETDDRRHPSDAYTVKENHVLTDSEICWIKYRSRPLISELPIYFIDLFVVALAARSAKPIADNSGLATEYRIQAFGPENSNGNGGMFSDAKALDAQSTPMKSLFQNGDPFSATRY